MNLREIMKRFAKGEAVRIRAGGGSMRPRINVGQMMTISRVDLSNVYPGDVVLVRWRDGGFLVHLAIDVTGDQLLLGNNLGKINGWIPLQSVLGKVTEVSDD